MTFPGDKHVTALCGEVSTASVAELRKMAIDLDLPLKSNAPKNAICALLAERFQILTANNVRVVDPDEDEDPLVKDFRDPISQDWLFYPICASDGFSYNYSTFQGLLQAKGSRSPFNNKHALNPLPYPQHCAERFASASTKRNKLS